MRLLLVALGHIRVSMAVFYIINVQAVKPIQYSLRDEFHKTVEYMETFYTPC